MSWCPVMNDKKVFSEMVLLASRQNVNYTDQGWGKKSLLFMCWNVMWDLVGILSDKQIGTQTFQKVNRYRVSLLFHEDIHDTLKWQCCTECGQNPWNTLEYSEGLAFI